jgi:hypothetical protein
LTVKDVSQAFKDSISREDLVPVRRVYYKRRYWDQADMQYVWESDWTQVQDDEVESVSSIVGQLDTERLNEFKISNLTVTLKNDQGQWNPQNSTGKFGPDSGSTVYGYEPFWTKFKITAGLVLADGSTETTDTFVGLAVDFKPMVDHRIQIPIQGMEALLMNADAENVSTRVVEENVGTGNGATVDFTTAEVGVGIIEEVSVAGITKKIGTDVTTSQLNEATLPAKITFAVAPASGIVRVTYRYWQQNQSIETLVGDLLTEASVPAPDQNVDAVLFPIGVTTSATRDTQAEWLTGTLSKLEASISPGNVKMDFADSNHKILLDDFSDGNFSSNPTWVNNFGTFAIDSNRLRAHSSGDGIHTTQDRKIGSWQCDVQVGTRMPNTTITFWFFGIGPWPDSNTGEPANGYAVQWAAGSSGLPAMNKLSLIKQGTPQTVLSQVTKTGDTSSHTIRVVRYSSGRMIVYWDGTAAIDYTDNSITTCDSLGFHVSGQTAGNYVYMDNIYYPSATLTGVYTSSAIDALSTPTAWGKLTPTHSLGSGTITYETRSSTDGISWDAWIEISEALTIQSALKRYLQFRFTIDLSSSLNGDPYVDSVVIDYRTSATLVSLANFTGKTVYESIQGLGKLANYEWGFKPDETFFFRAKTVSTDEDAALHFGLNLMDISDFTQGYDRVYSEVRATYGDYTAIIKASGDNPADPKARLVHRVLEVDGGDILVDPDTDLATGSASLTYTDVSRPKKRFRAKCKFMPHVDLSDTVSVSFLTVTPRGYPHHGDPSLTLGDPAWFHFGPEQQIADGMIFKVLGYRHDPEEWISEFELQEILQ